MEDYYAHIDDYVNGKLDDEQKALFEAAMEENASLKKAVDNYDTARKLSEGLLEVDMLETLDRLKKSSLEASAEGREDIAPVQDDTVSIGSPRARKGIFRRQWLAAAVFFGLLAVTAWWMMRPEGTELNKKYVLDNYIRPYDEDSTKSIDEPYSDPFKEGKRLFNLNRFEESIPFFDTFLSGENDKKLQSKGYLWLGAAHLEMWQVEKAREAWQKSEEEDARTNLELIKK